MMPTATEAWMVLLWNSTLTGWPVMIACSLVDTSSQKKDRLKNSQISRVVLTNTLPLPPDKQIDKIEVLSIAPLIADALSAVFDDTSVSDIFGGENQS